MNYRAFFFLRNFLSNKRILFVLIVSCLPIETVFSHGAHKNQPSGIIDPLVTHHAILEDELKLNYFNVRSDDENVTANLSTLEIAVAFTDLVGIEIFLPFGSVDIDGKSSSGIGDIETFIPKMSFVRKYGFVMTTYVGVRVPVGDESAGLGDRGWGFAPHLLMDYGKGNFGLQANVAVEIETEGDNALEGNLSFAYSFLLRKKNNLIVSPLIEFNAERPLNGLEANTVVNTILGIKIAYNGWHLGLGVELPVTDEKEFDRLVTVQLGYHVIWEKFFR